MGESQFRTRAAPKSVGIPKDLSIEALTSSVALVTMARSVPRGTLSLSKKGEQAREPKIGFTSSHASCGPHVTDDSGQRYSSQLPTYSVHHLVHEVEVTIAELSFSTSFRYHIESKKIENKIVPRLKRIRIYYDFLRTFSLTVLTLKT